MCGLVEKLADICGWGNARDMSSLAREMYSLAFKVESAISSPKKLLTLPDEDAISCMKTMLDERMRRQSPTACPPSTKSSLPTRTQDPRVRSPPPITTVTKTVHESKSELLA